MKKLPKEKYQSVGDYNYFEFLKKDIKCIRDEKQMKTTIIEIMSERVRSNNRSLVLTLKLSRNTKHTALCKIRIYVIFLTKSKWSLLPFS